MVCSVPDVCFARQDCYPVNEMAIARNLIVMIC